MVIWSSNHSLSAEHYFPPHRYGNVWCRLHILHGESKHHYVYIDVDLSSQLCSLKGLLLICKIPYDSVRHHKVDPLGKHLIWNMTQCPRLCPYVCLGSLLNGYLGIKTVLNNNNAPFSLYKNFMQYMNRRLVQKMHRSCCYSSKPQCTSSYTMHASPSRRYFVIDALF